MDYLNVFKYAKKVSLSSDRDQYLFKYDLDNKPLGFIYTNFSTDHYKGLKEIRNSNVST